MDKMNGKVLKKPELLAPAGNFEKLRTAVDFGADAVYLGGSKLNLRAFADNFTNEELREGIKYAHDRGRKVYVTLNVFPHDEDLVGLKDYLKFLAESKVDALLVSDPGIIMTAREVIPEVELHLSTQANNVNCASAIFWHNQGIKRIVLARELSIKEIKFMRKTLPDDIELEAFVHGAMCMSYSGRCILSNYMTGRDSNRGQCAQPCRYNYYLMEEKRPGQFFNVFEDDKGSYILNSKDLCMIEHIPELAQSGIDSFKIEGRMKSPFYVATVVKAYRQAIDEYYKDPQNYKFNEKWLKLLEKASHRPYYTGFYFGEKIKQYYDTSNYIRDYSIVGIVRDFDENSNTVTVEQRNKIYENDTVEILRPYDDEFKVKVKNMKDADGNVIESTPVAQMIYTFNSDRKLKKNDIIIKAKE